VKLAALKMKIEQATERLLRAEKEMEKALEQIGHAPRVEKSIISTALSTAFSEVKAARQALTGLEEPPPHGG